MNKKLMVVGVALILFGNVLLAANGKGERAGQNLVEIKTSDGKVTKLILSQSESGELLSMLQKLQEDPGNEIFLKILEKLEGKGVEGAYELKKAIMKGEDGSLSSPIFNILCLVAGYGDNAFIVLPRFFPIFWMEGLLVELFSNFPVISSLLNGAGLILYLCQTLRPRFSFPAGALVVARKGTVHTLGLLGYQHSRINMEHALPYPAVFFILGFKGIWIGFLKGMYEQCFFVGSAMAVFGG